MRQVWTARLGQQAEQDYIEILQWTAKPFGQGQAKTYAETVALANEALDGGPDALSAAARDDIQPGIRTLHVARQGRAGRHLVVFRVAGTTIDVLRLMAALPEAARSNYRLGQQPIPIIKSSCLDADLRRATSPNCWSATSSKNPEPVSAAPAKD